LLNYIYEHKILFKASTSPLLLGEGWHFMSTTPVTEDTGEEGGIRTMKEENQKKIKRAKLFYKFALAASENILYSNERLDYYEAFAYYRHVAKKNELELTRTEEKEGANILEHVGIYMMMLQLNKVLEDEWGKARIFSKDKTIRNISQVVRLIRNAFAHDPFKPTWEIKKLVENMEFEIPGVLILKTHNLDGKRVKPKDYGGQLALLRLLEFVEENF